MPLYEYRCETCGEVTEILQRHGDAPATVCASCGGPLKKLVSAPAFQFKGSGWYVTDYARSGGAGADKSTGQIADSEGAKKEAAKSEGSAPSEKAAPSEGAAKPAAPPAPPPTKPAKPD
jgi:putative FmdB family regulatory protein